MRQIKIILSGIFLILILFIAYRTVEFGLNRSIPSESPEEAIQRRTYLGKAYFVDKNITVWIEKNSERKGILSNEAKMLQGEFNYNISNASKIKLILSLDQFYFQEVISLDTVVRGRIFSIKTPDQTMIVIDSDTLVAPLKSISIK